MRKRMIRFTMYFLAATVLIFGTEGCANKKWELDIGYQADEAQKGPLSEVSSTNFAITKVNDTRANESIGKRRDWTASTAGDIFTSRDVSAIVQTALESELIANGHSIVPAEDADIHIEIDIQNFHTDMRVHSLTVEALTSIDGMIITKENNGELLLHSGQYHGFENFKKAALGKKDMINVSNIALKKFIRDFSRDPDFIEALHEARSASSAKLD